MATVSNFGVSLCLVFALFTVVEGQTQDDRASYLDAWWFIWMTVLLCLICGCGGGASYYRRRVWQQQQVAALRYQQQHQRYPVVCPRSCERERRDPVYVVDMAPGVAYIYPQDVTNGSPSAAPPMTAPVKPPPYQPRDDASPLGAPPAYQDAVGMSPSQPTDYTQAHWPQQQPGLDVRT